MALGQLFFEDVIVVPESTLAREKQSMYPCSIGVITRTVLQDYSVTAE